MRIRMCFATALLILPVPLAAQSVRGRVLEAHTDRPIAAGRIVLMTVSGEPVLTAASDAAGRFDIVAPGPGRFRLHAGASGYLGVLSEPVDLRPDETLAFQFRLPVHPLELDSLAVSVEARVPRLDRTGFYERRRTGLGQIIDRAEIDRRDPRVLSDLLRLVPGVSVDGGGGAMIRRAYAASLAGPCPPRVFLDGILVGSAGDHLIPVAEIEAVEIYRGPAEIPIQYGGAESACGVILIWSRG